MKGLLRSVNREGRSRKQISNANAAIKGRNLVLAAMCYGPLALCNGHDLYATPAQVLTPSCRKADPATHEFDREAGRDQKRQSRATLLLSGHVNSENLYSDAKADNKCGEQELKRRVLDSRRPPDRQEEAFYRLRRLQRKQEKQEHIAMMVADGLAIYSDSDDASSSSLDEDVSKAPLDVAKLRQQLLEHGYTWRHLRKQGLGELQALMHTEDLKAARRDAHDQLEAEVAATVNAEARDPQHMQQGSRRLFSEREGMFAEDHRTHAKYRVESRLHQHAPPESLGYGVLHKAANDVVYCKSGCKPCAALRKRCSVIGWSGFAGAFETVTDLTRAEWVEREQVIEQRRLEQQESAERRKGQEAQAAKERHYEEQRKAEKSREKVSADFQEYKTEVEEALQQAHEQGFRMLESKAESSGDDQHCKHSGCDFKHPEPSTVAAHERRCPKKPKKFRPWPLNLSGLQKAVKRIRAHYDRLLEQVPEGGYNAESIRSKYETDLAAWQWGVPCKHRIDAESLLRTKEAELRRLYLPTWRSFE